MYIHKSFHLEIKNQWFATQSWFIYMLYYYILYHLYIIALNIDAKVGS